VILVILVHDISNQSLLEACKTATSYWHERKRNKWLQWWYWRVNRENVICNLLFAPFINPTSASHFRLRASAPVGKAFCLTRCDCWHPALLDTGSGPSSRPTRSPFARYRTDSEEYLIPISTSPVPIYTVYCIRMGVQYFAGHLCLSTVTNQCATNHYKIR